MNSISLTGRLTREPGLKYIPQTGKAVLNAGIAVDRGLSKAKKQEAEAKGQPTADFIDIVAFGGTAEYIANYSTKGNRVALTGKLQTRSYTNKEGKNVKITEVVVDSVDIIDFKDRGQATEQVDMTGFHEVPTEDTPW